MEAAKWRFGLKFGGDGSEDIGDTPVTGLDGCTRCHSADRRCGKVAGTGSSGGERCSGQVAIGAIQVRRAPWRVCTPLCNT